jgi:hypothetical protein
MRLLFSLLAVVPVLAVAAPAEAKSCKPPKYPGSGYFTSLKVKGVGCDTGAKLAKAYYKCRTGDGDPAGKCEQAKVMKYTCKETRNAIPTEINARVTCTRGKRRVVHTYQQDT